MRTRYGGVLMVTTAPGWLIVGLLLVLPWTTWLPVTTTNPHDAVTQTPLWGFVLGSLLVVSLLAARADRWLAAFAAYLIGRALLTPTPQALDTVLVVVLGVGALMAVRQMPATLHLRLIQALVIAGVLQACYVAVQALGYDPLWMGLQAGHMQRVGTLGNATYVAGFLAMLAPLAPWWSLPFLLGGVLLTQSAMGLVAATVGLLVTWALSWRWWLAAGLAMLGALVAYPHAWASWVTRREVWVSLLTDQTWWTVLLGHGPGAWVTAPRLQWGEWFFQAHNEYLQLFYEGGLVAIGLVAAWVWAQQARLATSPVRGAVAAVAIVSLTMFPFHLAIPGLTAVTILGLATHEGDPA